MAFGVLQSHRQTVRLKCNRSVGRFARSTDAFQNSRFLFVATVVDLISIVERESSLCINRRPDVALGRFNNDARARADAAVMSHVAAVRELDEAVAAAMECEHAVSALKKAVADAKGAHRTSAFASEAVTARGAAEALVAAARARTRPSPPPSWRTSPPCAEVSADPPPARPTPTPPSTVGRRRPSSAPRSPPDRSDVDENARRALRRQLAELDQRDTVARLTAVPVTTVRLRLTRFRPPATRTSPARRSRRRRRARPRRARRPRGDFDGADALAALLPDMRAKLQLEHVAVVGVYGADARGARRCTISSTARSSRSKPSPTSRRRTRRPRRDWRCTDRSSRPRDTPRARRDHGPRGAHELAAVGVARSRRGFRVDAAPRVLVADPEFARVTTQTRGLRVRRRRPRAGVASRRSSRRRSRGTPRTGRRRGRRVRERSRRRRRLDADARQRHQPDAGVAVRNANATPGSRRRRRATRVPSPSSRRYGGAVVSARRARSRDLNANGVAASVAGLEAMSTERITAHPDGGVRRRGPERDRARARRAGTRRAGTPRAAPPGRASHLRDAHP